MTAINIAVRHGETYMGNDTEFNMSSCVSVKKIPYPSDACVIFKINSLSVICFSHFFSQCNTYIFLFSGMLAVKTSVVGQSILLMFLRHRKFML